MMNKNIKNIMTITCVCAIASISVLVINTTEETEQASVIEVYANNKDIEEIAALKLTGINISESFPNIDVIEEKIADFSQKYTAIDMGKYANKKTEIFMFDNKDSQVIRSIKYGDYIKIIGEDVYNKNGWYKVKTNKDECGFVEKKFLTSKILFKEYSDKKYVKDDIKVFKKHNMKSKNSILNKNDIVNVIGVNNELGIYKIKTASGIVGYIYENDTSDEMVFSEKETVKYSKKNNNPVYSSPDKNSDILKTFSKFNGIRILGYAKKWAKVRVDKDTIGYMDIKTFTEKCPQTMKAVSYAYSLLGTPYVWGGQTPEGTDCSGMTLQCYAHAGITIPRTAATQYYCGVDVGFENALPGDLLIWAGHGDGQITHVGMYVGNDTMIHASSTYHQVVETSASNYMTHSQLMGVIRVAP